jgi:enoyl-[acyl-carrier protein] reductase I
MLVKDKVFLVTGIASRRSIAFSIAQSLSEQGAQLILACQNEKLADRVREFTQDLSVLDCLLLDASSSDEIGSLSKKILQVTPRLDGFVHAIAYAPSEQLHGHYHEVITQEGFRIAHEVSSLSFSLIMKEISCLLEKTQGTALTLTYLGSERFVPNYNVMGMAKASLEASVRYLAASLGNKQVRVNAISAGPIKTLAASGISGFKKMLDSCASHNMLKRNVRAEEVAKAALFLLSDLSSAVTGEIMHVDCGFSKAAMMFTSD